MLRVGVIILTFWAGVRLLLALGILAMLLVFNKNAPVLVVLYGDIQGSGVDPRALATINALAILCNAAIAGMCLLSLTVIWCALVRRAAWAVWSLAACVFFLQGASFFSDALLHHPDLNHLPLKAGTRVRLPYALPPMIVERPGERLDVRLVARIRGSIHRADALDSAVHF
jgi:hypothetical protein